ncbi:MAG TPA: hypothetical protein VFP08_00955, partial [Acidimicrobiales bacterium]|nr:hypothetical protein [Acidimicrobiales bacterium]
MTGAPSPLLDRVVQLADVLRRGGIQVSTGELIDACRALDHLDLLDRDAVRVGLRAAMVKEPLAAAQFDRAFATVFRPRADATGASAHPTAPPPREPPAHTALADGPAGTSTLSDAILRALEDG